MPSRSVAAASACVPTMNPGTSTRKISGMWKVSHISMKCVCFFAAFTSMAPPYTSGLLAITPTTLPSMRARQVMTERPNDGWISNIESRSTIIATSFFML